MSRTSNDPDPDWHGADQITLFTGYPNNITYRWFKDDVDVRSISSLMERADVYADGSFVITSLFKEDSGWYKCRPSNGLGPAPEAQAYLNVTCEYPGCCYCCKQPYVAGGDV